jgi:hypothetical protein
MNQLNERIAASIRRNPTATNCKIANNFKNVSAATVAAVREKMGNLPAATKKTSPEAPQGSGIALRGMRVLSRRPAESAAKFIKRLPTGRGFDLKDLSNEWGMSEETIRKHARDLNCIKYVEVEPDEWVQLVMSPETAKTYTL